MSGEWELFLGGDVMTGRGVDQVLPFPGDPELHEAAMTDARDYVRLAERVRGPVRRPRTFAGLWGDALAPMGRADLRLANLETAVTTSGDWEAKGINYRMSPRNVPVLGAARLDAVSLANNHVLDWGRAGLRETLESLRGAGVRAAGAGLDGRAAAAPALLDGTRGARARMFAFACADSGVPGSWAAAEGVPGVNFLPDLSDRSFDLARAAIEGAGPADGRATVVSVHWGGNRGYAVPDDQRRFARRLVEEAGADVVHGHSSHHAKGLEVRRGRLILYGCGDLVSDYEGIESEPGYRDDLPLLWFARLRADGSLAGLRLEAMALRGFRLRRAASSEADFLWGLVTRESDLAWERVRDGVFRWGEGR